MVLSSRHLLRCIGSYGNVTPFNVHYRYGRPVCRGLSSSSDPVDSSSSSQQQSPLPVEQRSKPNIVRLADLKVDRPYTDEQFTRCIRPYHEQQRPVKFSTQHNAFPYNSNAAAKWSSFDYLKQTVGDEYPCDVEVRTSSCVTERITMNLGHYLDYLEAVNDHYGMVDPVTTIPSSEVMYMAQNDIPPTLLADVSIPGFCTDAQHGIGAGKIYNTMVWVGPRDSVSRLHYDPLDNVLMQIIGKKRIFLVDPTVPTDWIYVDTTMFQEHNMSTIPYLDLELDRLSQDPTAAKPWKTKRVENVESEYPNLLQIPTIYETVLYPGDVLFIPAKWWHAVRSLDTSISVNAWWR